MKRHPDTYPTILIDTREQRPWTFPAWVPVRMATIPSGDYALEGDPNFALERKSLNDFVGTVFHGWDRFQRELDRMTAAEFPQRIIIVEADYLSMMFLETEDEFLRPEHSHYRILPQSAAMRIAELVMMGVQVLFCHDAEFAALQAYQILMKRFRQLHPEGVPQK